MEEPAGEGGSEIRSRRTINAECSDRNQEQMGRYRLLPQSNLSAFKRQTLTLLILSSLLQIIDTNLFGVINGIATFLSSIRDHPAPSAIVITGSKQGITNPPGNPAYNASKAAVKSLAEHLSYDLRSTSTSVHLLIPGWTHTGLTGAESAKEKPDGAWTPQQVASHLEDKMGEDSFYILCPDNEVTLDKDRRRMLWTTGDVINERPPLSRWREEYKAEAEEWMAKQNV